MEHVEAMVKVLGNNGYLNSGKKMTFPIRAIYAGKSILKVFNFLKKKYFISF
jgi:hypothetical protein